MRVAIVAAVALVGPLALGGCLQAVDLSGSDQDAASGSPDSGADSRDVGVAASDAGSRCDQAAQCPQPVSPDPVCAPLVAICEHGVCGSKPVPRPWDDRLGACEIPEHCGCQQLTPPQCAGAWECRSSTCAWVCEDRRCTSDLECRSAQICADDDCDGLKTCVTGCRDSQACPAGKICELSPLSCDLLGHCVGGKACSIDSQCPAGTVCDFNLGGTRICQPGCHESSQCAADEQCFMEACPACPNCACIGTCEKSAGCQSDSQCAPGTVCGTEPPGCVAHCLPGCRTDTDCRIDQTCSPPPPCIGCGCDHGDCVPREVTCTDSSECEVGLVCAYEDPMQCEGPKHCVAGCLLDTDCAGHEYCQLAWCGPCCVGTCEPRPSGCTDDRQCAEGQICAYDDTFQCQGQRHCVDGCRESADCGEGAVCMLADCGPCCPGWCAPIPVCIDDAQCGAGEVCEGCGPNEPRQCVTGCRDGSDCAASEICMPTNCGGCPCPMQCTAAPRSCRGDSECGAGKVCDGCPGSPKTCIPGCHDSSQCGAGETCDTSRPCVTCPCPGQCTGATSCPFNEPACAGATDCAWGQSVCENACCVACRAPLTPPCLPEMCMHPAGIDGNGCPLPAACGNCCACPDYEDPVCGTNYQTYGNGCEAACAGAEVLHDGACLPYEGLDCGWNGQGCVPGQYCRDPCPMCADIHSLRCTQVGVCEYAFDCPAGLPTPPCPSGAAIWDCIDHQCMARCH
ncbi:MAG: hypothetical protein HY901_14415 [Deltaproteobacteria bacterium]|nr:hypothetical protein [Deltaproteobacteria bacterium]